MTIVKSKPTSPGRRFRVKIANKDLHKGEPYEPLLAKLNKSGGRNNQVFLQLQGYYLYFS